MNRRGPLLLALFLLPSLAAGQDRCATLTPALDKAGGGMQLQRGTPAPAFALRIATGTPGGAYQQFASGLESELRNGKQPIVRVSTFGSLDNLCRLVDGSVSIALVQGDVAHLAWFRHAPFESLATEVSRSLKVVAPLFTEAVHIFVSPHANITSTTEMKAKRVWLGRLGSGSERNAVRILEASGLSPGDIATLRIKMPLLTRDLARKWKPADGGVPQLDVLRSLGFADKEQFDSFLQDNMALPFPALIKLLENGQLDAVFQTSAIRSERITEVYDGEPRSEVRLLGLEWKVIERVLALDAGYVEAYIARNIYYPKRSGILTVGVQSLLLANATVSDETVAQLGLIVSTRRRSLEASMAGVRLDLLGVAFPERLDEFRHARGHFPDLALRNAGDIVALCLLAAALLMVVFKVPRMRRLVGNHAVLTIVLLACFAILLWGAHSVHGIEGHINEHYSSLVRSAASMLLYKTISPGLAPFTQHGRESTETYLSLAGFVFVWFIAPIVKTGIEKLLLPPTAKEGSGV